jgi:serine/threonine protein kinase
MTLPPGEVVHNRYRIERLIGMGGMGAVYEAFDQKFSRKVALKQTLLPDKTSKELFEREAQILGKLKHESLPHVHDSFPEGNRHFLVMEYIEGKDLDTHMRERGKPLSEEEVIGWAIQILDALKYLHKEHIIHRDIKPANITLTKEGKIFLLDFGIAKSVAEIATPEGQSLPYYTLNYASPEQIDRSGTDVQSDLFSFAATIYHLLTGKPPISVIERKMNANQEALPPPPGVNQRIQHVLVQALNLDPDKRPASAEDMLRELRKAQEELDKLAYTGRTQSMSYGSPRQQSRPSSSKVPWIPITIALVLVAIAIGASIFVLGEVRSPSERPIITAENIEQLTLLAQKEEHSGNITSVAFDPESKMVASGADDGSVRLWDVWDKEDELIRTLWGENDKVAIKGIAFLPNDEEIVVGRRDGQVQVWDTNGGDAVMSGETHSGGIFSVAVSPDGEKIAAGSLDHSVHLWERTEDDLTPLEAIGNQGEHAAQVESVAFSPGGEMLAVGAYNNIFLWDVEEPPYRLRHTFGGSSVHTGIVFSIVFSPEEANNELLASGSEDKSIRMWSTQDNSQQHALIHDSSIYSIAFSPDGELLAAGSDNGMIVWHVEDEEILRTEESNRRFDSVSFSPDGRTLAAASGRTVWWWGIEE